ncbi:LapA family protein [Mycolicibacterium thermoresistibile]
MSSDPYDRPGAAPASGEHPPLSPHDIPPADPAGDEFSPAPADRAAAGSGVTRTRAAAMWSALAGGFLVLIVLLIFIAQNTESAEFRFLGWHWSLPLGVAILGAAVCGGLLTVAVGTARMYQLRRAAKKNARNHH